MKGLKRPRFARADWLKLGLRLLAEAGPDALTLERLCAAARRTKGSFYHHFPDHEAFLRALLQAWRAVNTERIIAEVEQVPGRGRRRALARIAARADHRLEQAVRRLGAINAGARAVLRQVDGQRIRYLARLDPRPGAHALALLEYAAFVGLQALFPDRPPAWHERLGEALARRLRR